VTLPRGASFPDRDRFHGGGRGGAREGGRCRGRGVSQARPSLALDEPGGPHSSAPLPAREPRPRRSRPHPRSSIVVNRRPPRSSSDSNSSSSSKSSPEVVFRTELVFFSSCSTLVLGNSSVLVALLGGANSIRVARGPIRIKPSESPVAGRPRAQVVARDVDCARYLGPNAASWKNSRGPAVR